MSSQLPSGSWVFMSIRAALDYTDKLTRPCQIMHYHQWRATMNVLFSSDPRARVVLISA